MSITLTPTQSLSNIPKRDCVWFLSGVLIWLLSVLLPNFSSAQASTYDFTFSSNSTPIYITGTLELSGNVIQNIINGSVTGSGGIDGPIVTLFPPGNGNPFGVTTDNILNPSSPFLTNKGFMFATSTGGDFQIFYDGSNVNEPYSIAFGGGYIWGGATGNFGINAPPVPEIDGATLPKALLLFGSLYLVIYSRRNNVGGSSALDRANS